MEFNSSSSSSVGLIVLLAFLVQVALLIVFLVMAANIGRIRKAIESDILGLGLGLSGYRFCQFCNMSCPFTATVCHRCGREIGAWVLHGGVWWAKADNGVWVWRYRGSWYPPDDAHPAPA